MSEQKFIPISIKDSPVGLEKNLFIQDCVIEKSVTEEKFKEILFKGIESYEIKERDKGIKKSKRRQSKNVCVSDIFVNQLADFSKQPIEVQTLQKLLKNIEEINFLWREMTQSMSQAGELFQVPDFSEFDLNQKKSEKICSKSELIFQNQQNKEENNDSEQQVKPFSNQTKLQMLKLKRYYRVFKRKLLKFLKASRESNKRQKILFCKFCGLMFQSGRQMGGHMSRHHPGMSDSFRIKRQSQKANSLQRKRRGMWKKAKETTQGRAENSLNSSLFHEFQSTTKKQNSERSPADSRSRKSVTFRGNTTV